MDIVQAHGTVMSHWAQRVFYQVWELDLIDGTLVGLFRLDLVVFLDVDGFAALVDGVEELLSSVDVDYATLVAWSEELVIVV